MCRTSLLLVALVAASMPRAPAQTCSVEASKDDLELSLSLPKQTFTGGEPIIATLALRNCSASSRRLAEPTRTYGIAGFRVTQTSGAEPLPALVQASIPGPPRDFRWDFAPGEARVEETDLELPFEKPLPVGSYCVCATYAVPSYIGGVWQGSITTPELAFTVVAREGAAASVAQAFRDARYQVYRTDKARSAAEALAQMKDPERGGEFAKYAGYWAAMARMYVGEREEGLRELREYAEAHGSVPFCGKQAIRAVAEALYYARDYRAARAAFERLPDSYERRYWLKRCEEQLTQ